jgi:hypothetical protein
LKKVTGRNSHFSNFRNSLKTAEGGKMREKRNRRRKGTEKEGEGWDSQIE